MQRSRLAGVWVALTLVAACGNDDSRARDAGSGGAGGDAAMDADTGDDGAMDAGDAGDAGDGVRGDAAMEASLDASATPDAAQGDACPAGAPGEPPADYVDLFTSGARLEARMLVAEGMPEVFAGFYDTQLEVPCDFVRASDDAWRCLPREAQVAIIEGYADAQCTRALVSTSPSCATQNAYRRTPTECQRVEEVRKLEPVEASTPAYNDPDCQSIGDVEPAEGRFAESEPLDPTTFVKGTVRELPRACKASVRIVEAEDGATAPLQLLDVAMDFACRRRDGPCSPASLVHTDPTLFADDACTEAAVYGVSTDPPQCSLPDAIDVAAENVYRLVEGVYQGDVYSNVGGCKPAREQSWITTVFAPGAELPAERLARFEARREGSGRLQVEVLSEAGTRLMAATQPTRPVLYDTQREAHCVVQLFDDGTHRCVDRLWSQAGIGPDEYHDSSCEVPLFACNDECPGKVFVKQSIDEASCATEAPVSGIWKLRETATSYYRKDATGACYDAGAPPSNRWVGDSVDETALATVEVQARK